MCGEKIVKGTSPTLPVAILWPKSATVLSLSLSLSLSISVFCSPMCAHSWPALILFCLMGSPFRSGCHVHCGCAVQLHLSGYWGTAKGAPGATPVLSVVTADSCYARLHGAPHITAYSRRLFPQCWVEARELASKLQGRARPD
jgi:hypothetical protein